MDVMPTLLYLMGIPLPQGLDGGVIKNAIEPEILAAHPVQTESETRPETSATGGEGYTEEELRNVLDKLRALGYVE
jgi:arylsulfatase A-like enzyme